MRYILIISLAILIASCGETKLVFKGNKVYKYENNQDGVVGKKDQIIEYEVINSFKTKLKDKSDYYQIESVNICDLEKVDSARISPSKVGNYKGFEDIYYTSESKIFLSNKSFEKSSFRFYYGKFALNALTVPLKFRGTVGNDTINPPTLETGFNVNFAPSYRFNWSSYNPNRKFLGKDLSNYSITLGAILGIGGTDLKIKTNSPGLLSDRKSAMYSYGGMILFGVNSFGVGYAFGFDKVLGTGSKNWVYQDRLWHGVILSIDLIK